MRFVTTGLLIASLVLPVISASLRLGQSDAVGQESAETKPFEGAIQSLPPQYNLRTDPFLVFQKTANGRWRLVDSNGFVDELPEDSAWTPDATRRLGLWAMAGSIPFGVAMGVLANVTLRGLALISPGSAIVGGILWGSTVFVPAAVAVQHPGIVSRILNDPEAAIERSIRYYGDVFGI